MAANINVPDVADGSDATAVNAHIPQKSLNASIPNVWLLHPGSVMQARYSPYHTFRIHIKGVARYHLIPPIDVERCAYLYPNTHVSHGQSQVDFSEPDLSLTPAFINISVHEVKVLKAGEVIRFEEL